MTFVIVLLFLFCPPLVPRPVDLDIDGTYGWAYADPATGEITGSDNRSSFHTTTESMIKPWIAADYLARHRPTPYRLGQITRMIVDSDDEAAQSLYLADGADAVIGRLVKVCGLTDTRITSTWWSLTQMSPADAVLFGMCLRSGRAAGAYTDWLLAQMRAVRGGLADQHATTGGGRWGIIDGLPGFVAPGVAIKNGWTEHGDEWRVNCLAIDDQFVLAVMVRYPAHHGLAYGANVCAEVARQLEYRRPRYRAL